MSKTMPKQQPGRSRQDYRTPKAFLQATRTFLAITDFYADLAATKATRVTRRFYSPEINALGLVTWPTAGWNWLNPPFANIAPWAEKAYRQSRRGSQTCMLVPLGCPNWWADWVDGKALVVLLNGRLTFQGEKTPYPKDCALLLYSPFIRTPGYVVWRWTQQDGQHVQEYLS